MIKERIITKQYLESLSRMISNYVDDEKLVLEDVIVSLAMRYFLLLSYNGKYEMLNRIVSEYEHEACTFEQHEQLGELLHTPPKEA